MSTKVNDERMSHYTVDYFLEPRGSFERKWWWRRQLRPGSMLNAICYAFGLSLEENTRGEDDE